MCVDVCHAQIHAQFICFSNYIALVRTGTLNPHYTHPTHSIIIERYTENMRYDDMYADDETVGAAFTV